MGLFKEHACACCNKKTNMVTRSKLKDGNYVCLDCKPAVPTYVMNCLREYDLEAFHELKKYATYSETVLRSKFKKTNSFYSIHLDANHGLFYIDGGALSSKLYLKIEDIESFELWYEADKYKGTTFTEKVTGNIKLSIVMRNPYFQYETDLASGVKADAHLKGIITKKVEYKNPKGMDEFKQQFIETYNKFVMTPDLSR